MDQFVIALLHFADALPRGAEIDIRRESIVEYLKSGKRIATAVHDPITSALLEGKEIHLTRHNTIRIDANDLKSDNLGELPRFERIKT